MEFVIKEYETYNELEILNLYKSVGWINYTDLQTCLSKTFTNREHRKDKLTNI